ncbi:MAG: FAD-dependent oxidoreductase [Mesorhizobium sp.]|nr:MAG: FAD-dependent oxidoreductase [Mesorhizobium sp.]RWN08726.1 MAG: FAD-dependent oxidoreductase [Mesorhizobium sp.]RWN16152.1 MAG: FAD-dependent oxidoreductase [Mesorhizobium sp.]TIQ97546.1 MAG: FAD-dependent oxidoreductase [Mesorhizobium sp.]
MSKPSCGRSSVERRDVVIVGGGPAGLAAARHFADLGVTSVTVFEREQEAGGIPRHCGHTGFGWESHRRIWTGPGYAAALRRDVEGLDVRTGHTVLKIENGVLRVQNSEGVGEIAAKQILLATGTRETPRSARFVGGSRPRGVMNTGALQAHVYLHKHRPFERPLIVGTELVSFSAILTCRHLGIRPVAMIEENARITAPWPGALVARLVFGVPVSTRTRLLAIEGREQTEAVQVLQEGRQMRIACDGVILTGRFVPEASLLATSPKVLLAGNVQGAVKTSGRCWREGWVAAQKIARSLT